MSLRLGWELDVAHRGSWICEENSVKDDIMCEYDSERKIRVVQ